MHHLLPAHNTTCPHYGRTTKHTGLLLADVSSYRSLSRETSTLRACLPPLALPRHSFGCYRCKTVRPREIAHGRRRSKQNKTKLLWGLPLRACDVGSGYRRQGEC